MVRYLMLLPVAIKNPLEGGEMEAVESLERKDVSALGPEPGGLWQTTLETLASPEEIAQEVAQVAEEGEVLVLFREDDWQTFAYRLESRKAKRLKVAVLDGTTLVAEL